MNGICVCRDCIYGNYNCINSDGSVGFECTWDDSAFAPAPCERSFFPTSAIRKPSEEVLEILKKSDEEDLAF